MFDPSRVSETRSRLLLRCHARRGGVDQVQYTWLLDSAGILPATSGGCPFQRSDRSKGLC